MFESNASIEAKKRHLRILTVTAIVALVVLEIVSVFWRAYIPYGPFEFWTFKSSPITWLAVALPIIFWGLLLQGTLETARTRSMSSLDVYKAPKPSAILSEGLRISVAAGVMEEIVFRWLLFLGAMVTLKAIDIPLSWVYLNFDKYLHEYFFGPIANVMTLGALRDVLFHDAGWHVGGALLLANAKFRDGHKYQGPLGFVNSWFAGMYFFWAMLTYGIHAAIVAHTLYDITVFGTVAFAASARLRGWVPLRSGT